MGFHLLWLTDHYPPSRGGMAQSCDRLVYHLRRSGVTVDVVHFPPNRFTRSLEHQDHGRHFHCPLEDDPAHAMNVFWTQLSRDPQRDQWTHVVVFGGQHALIAGPVYAAWLAKPLVTLLRGNDMDLSLFLPRRSEVLHQALQRSNHVCVVSQEKVSKLKALYLDLAVSWIPNGIDLEEWQALPSHHDNAQQWRESQHIGSRQVIGLFGQLKRKKGVIFFLETLLRSGIADQLFILCVGDWDASVSQWIEEHPEGLNIHCQPFKDRDELLPYYLACDWVAIPSFYDGMPNVMLEAGALGIPFLASTVDGMGDFLREAEHGFFFAPGDQHECRYALTQASETTVESRKHLGQQCQILIQQLTPQREVERYCEVFQSVQQ